MDRADRFLERRRLSPHHPARAGVETHPAKAETAAIVESDRRLWRDDEVSKLTLIPHPAICADPSGHDRPCDQAW